MIKQLQFMAAALAFTSVSSGAAIVANGSFEALGQPSTLAPGWSSIGVDFTGGEGTSDGRFAAVLGGGRQAAGGLWQMIATQAGTTYQLSFDYGAFGDAMPESMAIQVNGGALLNKVINVTGSGGFHTDFLHYAYTFKATGSNTWLAFSAATSVFGTDGVLDNVAVSTVPEPSSFVMMACAVAGLAFVRVRQSRRGAAA